MYRHQIPKKTSPSSPSIPINQQTRPTPGYPSLSGVIQRPAANPETLGKDKWQHLNSAIGTRVTNEIKSGKRTYYVPEFKGVSAQLWGDSGQLDAPIQRKENNDVVVSGVQPENNTGLPDNLKAGVENLSGYSLDNVRVHYNSPKPAQLQALAYTQGTDIHIAPRQEEHLPHEAWHVVQQMQGRVKPTMQMKGVQINDDQGLEREADVMGERSANSAIGYNVTPSRKEIKKIEQRVVQLLSMYYYARAMVTYGQRATAHMTQRRLNNYLAIYHQEIVVGDQQSILVGEGRQTGYGVRGQIIYDCSYDENHARHNIHITHAHDHGRIG